MREDMSSGGGFQGNCPPFLQGWARGERAWEREKVQEHLLLETPSGDPLSAGPPPPAVPHGGTGSVSMSCSALAWKTAPMPLGQWCPRRRARQSAATVGRRLRATARKQTGSRLHFARGSAGNVLVCGRPTAVSPALGPGNENVAFLQVITVFVMCDFSVYRR